MSGAKVILKYLRQWFQDIIKRTIRELRTVFNIKRYSRSKTKGGISTRGHDFFSESWEREKEIQDLIVDHRFEEACSYAGLAYYGKLRKRCAKKLSPHVPNPEADAEEITQQVFLEFWGKLQKEEYDPSKASVLGYLYTIADGRVIDKLRTPNRIVPGRDTEVDELDHSVLQGFYWMNPELKVLEDELRIIVNREVERLPDAERQLLHWRYTLGHPAVKIAQFTGTEDTTIRSRILRICRKLRELCNSDD